MIRYEWEPLASVLKSPNLAAMIREQAEELSAYKGVPLHVDFDWLLRLEAAGQWKAFTVRSDGTLIGYIPWFLTPHPHHAKSLFATCDNFYLDPAWRSGGVGLEMFRRAFAAVEALGPAVIRLHSKLHKAEQRTDIGKFFERQGFTPIETLFAKIIRRG